MTASAREWLDTLTVRYLHRRTGHLTPRYLLDLARVRWFELRQPRAPWLTKDAVSILATALRTRDVGLEYGSGRSTIWFARRTAHLISVESNAQWYTAIRSRLESARLTDKVDYRLIPAEETQPDDIHRADYLAVAETIQPCSLDYVLIDGIYRAQCAIQSVELLKFGGLLIVDNINVYLPSWSRSPLSVRGAADPVWVEFQHRVEAWRRIWTTSGVTDTAIYIRAP